VRAHYAKTNFESGFAKNAAMNNQAPFSTIAGSCPAAATVQGGPNEGLRLCGALRFKCFNRQFIDRRPALTNLLAVGFAM
jgi:hypothetical protein